MKAKPWESPYGQRKEKSVPYWVSGIDAAAHAVLVPLHDKGDALLFLGNAGLRPINFGPFVRKRSYYVFNFRTERDAAAFRLSYPNQTSLPE